MREQTKMNKWHSPKIRSSEITPEAVYLNRRQFMTGRGLGGGWRAAGGLRAANDACTGSDNDFSSDVRSGRDGDFGRQPDRRRASRMSWVIR